MTRQHILLLLLVCSFVVPAAMLQAQTCFDYVDSCSRPGWTLPFPHPDCVNAKVPIRCVTRGSVGTGSLVNCNWSGDCHEDGDPSDCCTTVAGPTQAILQMHTAWHNCFGNVGDSDGNNPPGRGNQWYAFHRQFEFDFNQWRADIGFLPIESLDWCPSMNLSIGHPSGGWPSSGSGAHPAFCGTGPNRPNNVACPACVSFPQCLFRSGAGPIACPTSPSSTCGISGLSFPYTSLDQFANVEEVATILDHFFHGQMHGAVAAANRHGPNCDVLGAFGTGSVTNCYVLDVANPVCSPRDPMFWRLHKALDDVVRAWQNVKAVDVVLVVDTSGSMSDLDSGGATKLEAALDAVDSFADLMDLNRADGQTNRIGVVSFASSATVRMGLTNADPTLRAPGGPLDTAINAIRTGGPSGCTGIGPGIQAAAELLCPPSGDCRGFSASGDNDRKAILLLTDGMENRPPCLQSAGPTPSGSCGNQCFGAQFDIPRLEFTQMVGVGFGNAGSLNGDLLTLLAERQGGLYMQNPNGPADDLKDFFAKGFGQLTADFLALDPKGTLAASDAASDPVTYGSCADSMITFASGWKKDVTPGALRLLVNSPSGELVRSGTPAARVSNERVWSNARVRLPYRSDAKGEWRAQLVRPHNSYVNGFLPDSLADFREGVQLVRRQIQRLCPDGCRRVLLYEEGLRGRSVYAAAVAEERSSGVLGGVDAVRSGGQFSSRLNRPWDLIVYAYAGRDRRLPFDGPLSEKLCARQRAIISDIRIQSAPQILRCAGAVPDGTVNWKEMQGDGRLLVGTLAASNPGHAVATYGLTGATSVQATANSGRSAAITARIEPGVEQQWFVDVLTEGLSRLSPVRQKLEWKTGEDLVAVVRMLPSDVLAGGYDSVDARVEIEYPTVGLGTLLARARPRDPRQVRGEVLDPRAAALAGIVVPTKTATFPLYDDGTHGDQHAGNAYWTTTISGITQADGMYKLRFIFDLTSDGCTTRRELTQSMFVDVEPTNTGTKFDVVTTTPLGGGRVRTQVVLRPGDSFGNLVGPGRNVAAFDCVPKDACSVDALTDQGDGTYAATIVSPANRRSVRVSALGSAFDIPLACDRCPKILRLNLPVAQVNEHSNIEATVFLSAPSPADGSGTVVHLSSSDRLAVAMPESVIVPAGQDRVTVPLQVMHAHEGPRHVTLTASDGRDARSRSFTVIPLPPRTSEVVKPKEYFHSPGHGPYPQPAPPTPHPHDR